MIYQKIQNCRDIIKKCNLEKKGWNEYSKYKYYLPEQVDELVYKACVEEKLFTKYDLLKNEFGLYGQLTVIDLESEETAVFSAFTEMPQITATNASQQMGGAMTFSNRYLLMFAFDIVDNNLDPDTTKKNGKKPEPETLKTINLVQCTEIQDAIKARQIDNAGLIELLNWCTKAWGYPVKEVADIRQKNMKAVMTIIQKKPLKV